VRVQRAIRRVDARAVAVHPPSRFRVLRRLGLPRRRRDRRPARDRRGGALDPELEAAFRVLAVAFPELYLAADAPHRAACGGE
jgi:hypothetical protein